MVDVLSNDALQTDPHDPIPLDMTLPTRTSPEEGAKRRKKGKPSRVTAADGEAQGDEEMSDAATNNNNNSYGSIGDILTTCVLCGEHFDDCSILENHIAIVHLGTGSSATAVTTTTSTASSTTPASTIAAVSSAGLGETPTALNAATTNPFDFSALSEEELKKFAEKMGVDWAAMTSSLQGDSSSLTSLLASSTTGVTLPFSMPNFSTAGGMNPMLTLFAGLAPPFPFNSSDLTAAAGLKLPSTTACKLCNVDLLSVDLLRLHMSQKHGLLTGGAEAPGSAGIELYNNNMAAKIADRVMCEICQKEVCNKYFLKSHKQRVHGIAPEPNSSNRGRPPNREKRSWTDAATPDVKASPPTSCPGTPAAGSPLNLSSVLAPKRDALTGFGDDAASIQTMLNSLSQLHGAATPAAVAPPPESNASGSWIDTPEMKAGGVLAAGSAGRRWRWKEPASSMSRVTCDICVKELCNKYFLKTHRLKKHGITDDSPTPSIRTATSPPLKSTSPTGDSPILPVTTAASARPVREILPKSLSHADMQDTDPAEALKGSYTDPAFTELCKLCPKRFKSTNWLALHMFSEHNAAELPQSELASAMAQIAAPATLDRSHSVYNNNVSNTVAHNMSSNHNVASVPNGVSPTSSASSCERRAEADDIACNECGFAVSSAKDLELHMTNLHGVAPKAKCPPRIAAPPAVQDKPPVVPQQKCDVGSAAVASDSHVTRWTGRNSHRATERARLMRRVRSQLAFYNRKVEWAKWMNYVTETKLRMSRSAALTSHATQCDLQVGSL